LVAITHVSNALGTVNPIKRLVEIAHAHGVPVLVDGAQSVPHCKIDVQDLDVDFLAFSGHKIYGPTGIGVLYGKEKWLEKLPPYQGGGEMIKKVTFEKTTYNELPFKFEAGTPDYIGSTALAAALDYVSGIGMENIAAHEQDLIRYATQRMKVVDGLRFIRESPEKSGLISFLLGNIHPYDTGSILDKLGVAVRTGHHCAEPVMDALGIEGTVRASFAIYNTKEEVDVLVSGLERVNKMFNRRR
jgi:cysteine desulfurase/selenocysteine lyase